MGTDYVITGANHKSLLEAIQGLDGLIVKDSDWFYTLSVPIDKPGREKVIRQGVQIAKTLDASPDDILRQTDYSTITLDKDDDGDNSWLTGWAVSVNHPEVILDQIVECLEQQGYSVECYSEHDEDFFDYD